MEREEFYQAFVENALEMAIFFDTYGKILYINSFASKQLEYDWGKNNIYIQDIFPNEFAKNESVQNRVEELKGHILTVTAYRKNRTCFPIKAKFVENEILSDTYFCVAIDETDKIYFEKMASRADEEAKEANKLKTEFVATITHELRTPVNGIMANTQDLLSKETDEKKLYILQMMERGCRDMSGLINNILDFSKLEAGKFTLEKREFDFRAMMDYVKTNHQKKITEKGLDFFCTISPEVPEKIVGDELRIVQILNNLISNATKFTDIGKISVEVLKTAQMDQRIELFFLVMDTGIGIDKEAQDKLFKSFSQVDASISRRFGGTGLGLNISKQLVELMDGQIRVESEPGKGSIFSFHIWVELTEKEAKEAQGKPVHVDSLSYVSGEQEKLHTKENSPIWQFGTAENKKEIDQKIDKMILCVELGNYEKAEMFADTLKKLTSTADSELRQATLRLKMAVQRADYEKIIESYEEWKALYGGTE